MDRQQEPTDWQRQIEDLDRSIALWESGTMKAWNDGKDVTEEYVDGLRRNREGLKQAVQIVGSDDDG